MPEGLLTTSRWSSSKRISPFTTPRRSTRWPVHRPTAEQMHVQVRHAFTRMRALVDHQAIARAVDAFLPRDLRGYRQQIDRKSTRLNSSHLGISYAVFC